MSNTLYTVVVTDLGSYTVTVAAETPVDAEIIAKTILCEEVTNLPDGVQITKRELDAEAVVATTQPIRTFRVSGTYSIDFSLTVPATCAREAEGHARRLYEAEPYPWDHASGEEHVRWQPAREVDCDAPPRPSTQARRAYSRSVRIPHRQSRSVGANLRPRRRISAISASRMTWPISTCSRTGSVIGAWK